MDVHWRAYVEEDDSRYVGLPKAFVTMLKDCDLYSDLW